MSFQPLSIVNSFNKLYHIQQKYNQQQSQNNSIPEELTYSGQESTQTLKQRYHSNNKKQKYKGADCLYQGYIRQKLPNHTHQEVKKYVGTTMGINFMTPQATHHTQQSNKLQQKTATTKHSSNQPATNSSLPIAKPQHKPSVNYSTFPVQQSKPKQLRRDTLIPNKISIQRQTSKQKQISLMPTSLRAELHNKQAQLMKSRDKSKSADKRQQQSSIIKSKQKQKSTGRQHQPNNKIALQPRNGVIIMPDSPLKQQSTSKVKGKTIGFRIDLSNTREPSRLRQDQRGNHFSMTQRQEKNPSPMVANSNSATNSKKFKPKIRQKAPNPHLKSLLDVNPEMLSENQNGTDGSASAEQKIRIQKHLQGQKQKQILQKQARIQKQKIQKMKRMKNHIEQLSVLGIPYVYDDQGNIHSPDPKQYKNKPKLDTQSQNPGQCNKKVHNIHHNHSHHRNNKIIGINHNQTIDVSTLKNVVKDIRHLIGRKRGYFSSQFYKKLKMTNQQFNNGDSRQNTNIPFLNISEGIRIVERQRNIIAQKNRKNIPNLQQYKTKTQRSLFRSFIPQYQLSVQQNLNQGEQGHRPYTTGKFYRTTKLTSQSFTRTHMTITHGDKMVQKMSNSILWRPRTQSKGCRMNVCDKELVKKVIQIDDQE